MSILRNRHAKMLVTIGPASNSIETLTKLVEAGADAFRLNFSHGTHEFHKQNIENIRTVEKEVGRPLAILQDLQGPKIRLGMFAKGKVHLEIGDSFELDSNEELGNETRCHLPHPEILEVLQEGDPIYINDGLVRLRVREKRKESVLCEVTTPGMVGDRKGVNLPGVDLPISSITEKDWKDLEFGLTQDIDWVAVSFVQKPEDMQEVRAKTGEKVALLAKIEMPNAVKRLDAIMAECDALMVARGDLGVEMPPEEVPLIQKQILKKCREAGKPVVVATQMLESMITSPVPTRAEVSDVATATFDGADALMLSAESAAGDYPVEAVAMMDRVIRSVEDSETWYEAVHALEVSTKTNSVADAITEAAFTTADALDAAGILTFTESGSTAIRMSRRRPLPPILTLTPYEKTARRLALVWGVHCALCDVPTNQESMVDLAIKAAEDKGLRKKDKPLVLTAGVPFGEVGTTNMLRVV